MSQTPAGDGTSAAPPPKKRRRWPWILGGLFACFVLVLLLVPTVISLSPVRSFVTGKVGSTLGADVTIENWSFGWFSGQRIDGVAVKPAEGFGSDVNLLEVDSVQISKGIAGAAFGLDGLEVVVEKPIVRVKRSKDGVFSFDGLAGSSAGAEESTAPEKAPEKETGDSEPGELPQVKLLVRGAELHFDDQQEGIASTIQGVDVDVEVTSTHDLLLALKALVGHPDATPGSVALDGKIAGFVPGAAFDAAKLVVDISGSAKDVDLRPYAPLVQELTGITPPSKPIQGNFRVETKDGAVVGAFDADADYAGVAGGTLRVPIAKGGSTTIAIPWTANLDTLVPALGSLSGLQEGSVVRGGLSGTVTIEGPLSVEALTASPLSLAGVSLAVVANATDLYALLPPAPPAEGDEAEGAAADAETPAAPAEPFEISEKALELTLRATVGETLETILLDRIGAKGEGVDLGITGSYRAGSGEGDAAKPATVDLTIGAEGRVGSLMARVRKMLPEGIEVTEATVAKIVDLKVSGPLGADPVATLAVAGKAQLSGSLRYMGVAIEALDGDIALEKGLAAIRNLRATVNGGTLNGTEIALGLVGEKPEFKVALALDKVGLGYEMAPLIAWVLPFVGPEAQAGLGGAINASLSLQGAGFAWDDLKSGLVGKGDLRIADGQLTASPFFDSLSALLKTPLEGMAFREMGTSFSIGEGKIASDDMFFQPQKGKIRRVGLSGSTSLDRKLDYGVRLSALADAVGDAEIKRILTVAQKALGDDGLPLRLQGSITSPQLSLDMSQLQLSAGDLLKGALGETIEKNLPGGVGQAIEDSGVGGLLEGAGLGGVLGGSKEPKKEGEKEPEPKSGLGGLLQGAQDLLGPKKKPEGEK